MKGKILFLFLFYIFLIKVYCGFKENSKRKKIIPYFRQQVEGNFLPETPEKNNPTNNFEPLKVANVKDFFYNNDLETIKRSEPRPIIEDTVKYTKQKVTRKSPSYRAICNISSLYIPIASTTANTKLLTLSTSAGNIHENLPVIDLLDEQNSVTLHSTCKRNSELPKDKKKVKIRKKGRNSFRRELMLSSFAGNSSDFSTFQDSRKSCIMCNNLATENCNDPKKKLIESIICERDDDLCYSMNTPFGIIDRGCYSDLHNFTIYVCSCDICNYIPLAQMPHRFNNLQDWANNVVEISRSRHFKKTGMLCLSCEANTSLQKTELSDSDKNCLEGKTGNISVKKCDQQEICAIKALKADGYIWRGCVATPLYNYWWQLCDQDLCNYNPVLSLYDLV